MLVANLKKAAQHSLRSSSPKWRFTEELNFETEATQTTALPTLVEVSDYLR